MGGEESFEFISQDELQIISDAKAVLYAVANRFRNRQEKFTGLAANVCVNNANCAQKAAEAIAAAEVRIESNL